MGRSPHSRCSPSSRSIPISQTPLSTAVTTGRGGYGTRRLAVQPAGAARHARDRHQQQLLRQPRHPDADRAQRPARRRPAHAARLGQPVLPHNLCSGTTSTAWRSSRQFFVLTADETRSSAAGDAPANGKLNLTVNSVWAATDLTYVLRGTIVLAGYYDNPPSAHRRLHRQRAHPEHRRLRRRAARRTSRSRSRARCRAPIWPTARRSRTPASRWWSSC